MQWFVNLKVFEVPAKQSSAPYQISVAKNKYPSSVENSQRDCGFGNRYQLNGKLGQSVERDERGQWRIKTENTTVCLMLKKMIQKEGTVPKYQLVALAQTCFN